MSCKGLGQSTFKPFPKQESKHLGSSPSLAFCRSESDVYFS
jgi:hypothetical protein